MGRRRRRAAAKKQEAEVLVEDQPSAEAQEAADPAIRLGDSVALILPQQLMSSEGLLRTVLEGTIDCMRKVPAAAALFTPASIVQMIIAGEILLWRVKDDYVDGYVMTTVRVFPRARVLEAPFVFGKGLTRETFERYLGAFMEYGRLQGCSYFKGYGRKGWQRAGEAPSGWLEVREFLTEIPDAVQNEVAETVH